MRLKSVAVEWPTLLLLCATYGLWMLSTTFVADLSVPLAIVPMPPPREMGVEDGKPFVAPRVDTVLTLASSLFQVAVRGGATRQVTAAVAAALLRTAHELAEGPYGS